MNTPIDLTRSPKTDPLEIYRYRDGLYAVDLLTAAVTEFDFFTWLSENPSDISSICRELKIVERPADVMLTLFTANGFIRCVDGVFQTTELADEHLNSSSQFSLIAYYASLKNRPVVKDYITVLRTGKPANWGSYDNEKEWSHAMLTEEFATGFTAAMDCRGFYLGPAIAKRIDTNKYCSLLDIAGGSGIYACSMVEFHPHVKASVFERSPVDDIASVMIEKRGYSDRVKVESGDMFSDPLPLGFDMHLYSNVLHDWDFEKVRTLLAASYAALNPSGLLIVHDAHLNVDKTGPLPVAAYSALLMNITEGKCYSIAEMDTLLAEAGFSDCHFVETAADRSIITARKPD